MPVRECLDEAVDLSLPGQRSLENVSGGGAARIGGARAAMRRPGGTIRVAANVSLAASRHLFREAWRNKMGQMQQGEEPGNRAA